MTELLTARIARRVADRPGAVAVIAAEETVDYAEFWRRVERAASALSRMERVAILPTSDIESLVAVTAAMHCGTGVVLLHRHLPATHLHRILALAAPDAVLAVARSHRRLAALASTGYAVRTVDELSEDGTPRDARPDAELLLGITSGTTGEPKVFVRDQRSWAATLDRSDQVFDIGPGDHVAVPGVLDHTHFLYGGLHALTRGASVDLRQVMTALGAGATHLYSVPTIAWDVVRAAPGPLTGVREVLSSAARWPRTGRESLGRILPGARLVHFYGASELSFVSHDHGIGEDRSAGELFDGVEVEIRDGVVYVRSDMLFRGYLGERGLVGGPVEGWMTVGDRGRLEGSRLTLLGRDSEMFVRAGLNVEPAAVETALTGIEGVVEAACLGLPDPRAGHVPVAAIVVDDRAPDDEGIRRRLRTRLPTPSMPVRLLRVAALPRTRRGKLDRSALATMFAADSDS